MTEKPGDPYAPRPEDEPAPYPAPPYAAPPNTEDGPTNCDPARQFVGPTSAPPGYYPPGFYPPGYYGPAPTNSKAGWSLALGLAGFMVCPLTAVGAIILGNQAKEEIRRSHEQGEGMATAGVILGWVMCGLAVAGAVMILLIVAVAVGSQPS